MEAKKISSIILALALIFPLSVSVGGESVFASSNNLNVGLTIPTTTPPPPPPPDQPPIVGGVTVTSTLTTAVLTWTASDDHGVLSSAFQYGLTPAYGISGVVTGSYTTSLSGLLPGTQYFFQITVTDSVGQNGTYTGFFQTIAADVTPPTISSISTSTTSNSATISWSTNENADGQLQYGTTVAYGQSIINNSFVLNQTVNIGSLQPVTLYHFYIVATDQSGNSASTQDLTFLTLPDSVPPSDVSNLILTATTSTISLNWQNPNDTDFLNVRVIRKAGSAPTSPSDGTLMYTGSGNSFVDNTAATQITYYYMVYSYDTSGNRSGGTYVFGSLVVIPPAVEICNNNIDDDGNSLIDCADSACSSTQICAPPQNEICNNGIDDNNNGQTDCADVACSSTQICAPPPQEICSNGIDDNLNGFADCADPACVSNASCTNDGNPGGNNPEICNNNLDDNNNGQTDCADSACVGFPGCIFSGNTSTSTLPQVSVTSTVPVVERLKLSDLKFYGGNRGIELAQNNGVVTGLAGSDLSIEIIKSKLPNPLKSALVNFDNENHVFGITDRPSYYSDFSFPQIGNHSASIELNYGGGDIDVIKFEIRSLSLGQVLDGSSPIEGAEVNLYNENNSIFDSGLYGFDNPIETNVNGTFGWMVPNGKYYLSVSKDGYFTRKTPLFEVKNNVVNQVVSLILLPPKLDLNPQNIAKIVEVSTQLGLQKLSDTLIEVNVIADNPAVEETVTTVVAPTVVGVVAAGTIGVISWANIIPLLQLLFLQPLMLFGSKRKREAWGQVYNSLNKLPVDLASVRLLSADSGKVIQSKVTDSQGRYAFVVNPGSYRIEVTKNGFNFPSELLKGVKNDGQKIDIYHGEVISVTEKEAVITANLPLDPVGEHEKPTRLRFQMIMRQVQMIVWWVGLLITIGAIYVSPKWYLWLFLVIQIIFFAGIRLLARPPKIKSWGIVYDLTNKQPVGRVIARLFNAQFNKLVASQITDSKGRYYFLAGDNEYYVTYEHPSYSGEKTTTIDLKGHSSEAINVDMGLKPSTSSDHYESSIDAPSALQKTPKKDDSKK